MIEKCPVGSIDAKPIEINVGLEHPSNLPDGMEDFVAEGLAVGIPPKPPLVLFEKVGLGTLGREFSFDGNALANGVGAARPGESGFEVLVPGASVAEPNHGTGCIRFVVEGSGYKAGQMLRDELPNKHNPPALAVADIKAEVHLRKVHVARPGNSPDSGVEEVERDQAHKG